MIEIKVPELSESVSEAVLLDWQKKIPATQYTKAIFWCL
jgi:pyruvate/2-oxoglutarate dehydrogenase complex dihydrolipoamide acyltransferase (E2) component